MSVHVQGIVNAKDVNVRIERIVEAPKWTGEPLQEGQTVSVSGFASDPSNDEHCHRYQIEIGDRTLWTAAKYVDIDPDDAASLPYIRRFPGDAHRELREGLGITATEGTELDDEEIARLATFLAIDIEFAGNWNAEQLREALEAMETMRTYGAMLRSERGWTVTEIRAVYEAVRAMAAGAALFLRSTYHNVEDDPALAFRVLYAPLRITRADRDNVSTDPANVVWFARNNQGYEVILGNKVFFQGKVPTRIDPRLPFTTPQLIAHEIAHMINFRYNLLDSRGQKQDVDSFYEMAMQEGDYRLATGETVHLTPSTGYTFAARSSDKGYETVTDAIANVSYSALAERETGRARTSPSEAVGEREAGSAAINTLDRRGRERLARRNQIVDLMRRVIVLAVQDYQGIKGIRERIALKGGDALVGSMACACNTVCLNVLGTSLDDQVKVLGQKTHVRVDS